MSLRQTTPCDYLSVCPYNSESWGSCEYWCGSEEPEDYPEAWECGLDENGEAWVPSNFDEDEDGW